MDTSNAQPRSRTCWFGDERVAGRTARWKGGRGSHSHNRSGRWRRLGSFLRTAWDGGRDKSSTARGLGRGGRAYTHRAPGALWHGNGGSLGGGRARLQERLGDDLVSGFGSIRTTNGALNRAWEAAVMRLDIEFIFGAAGTKDFNFHGTLALVGLGGS